MLELSIDGEEGALAHEPPAPKPEATPIVELPGQKLPKVFRAKASTDKKVREAATTGIVWAAMTGMLVVIVGGGFVLRDDVVRIWPQTASVFAAVKAPVNRVGLQLEDIRAEPALQDGHAALSVSGVIRNVRSRPVTAPPLQVSLMNKQDKRVMAKIAQAADPLIPAGETRHFAVVLVDPPKTASIVEVAFVTDGPPPAKVAKPKGHAPAKEKTLTLRGSAEPTPVGEADAAEAKPLPASDPHALPAAASEGHH